MKLILTTWIILCLLTFWSSFHAIAQPAMQWQKSLGGSNTDYMSTVIQTTDGGFIAVGYSNSNDGDVNWNQGDNDCWIVKLNSTGNIVWQKTLGGSGTDEAVAVQQTADGGYVVAASTNSNDGDVSGNHGSMDYWIFKLSSNGTLVWQKTFGGSNTEIPTSLQKTFDGGYIVSGYTNSNDGDVSGNHSVFTDYWIIKLNDTGVLQWQKALGSSGWDMATAVQQTSDSGYIVAGEAFFPDGDVSVIKGNVDYWIVKLYPNGNLAWEKSYGGIFEDHATDIVQTSDGGYIVAGYSNSDDGDKTQTLGFEDYWIIKLHANGSLQWERSLGGSFIEHTGRIWQTADGGYIVNGITVSTDIHVTGLHGGADAWIAKMDGGGNLLWQQALGGSMDDQGVSIQQTSDGGFILACNSFSNDALVSGHHGSLDSLDGWIVKLSAPLFTQDFLTKNQFWVYPNPTQDVFTVQCNNPVKNACITLYNWLGETVYSGVFSGETIRINNPLKPGIYLLQVNHDSFTWTEKIQVGFK